MAASARIGSVAPAAGVAGADLGGAWGIRGRLALLAEPKLARGVPEVGVRLRVDQVVDRSRGRVALQPAGAVVGPRVRAVVLLGRDAQPEVLEHAAVVLGL